MRIEALTFLRFFAALVVVVFHYGRGTGLSRLAHPLMISGSQMVTFFFVLSGFVLMVSYCGRGGLTLGKFYRARMARIAPIYWVALLWSVLALGQPPIWRDLLLHTAGLQAWVPGHVYQLNFPGWSISVEAFFYASFPLLLLLVRKHRPSPRMLLGSACLLWLLTQVALSWSLSQPGFSEDKRLWFDGVHFLPINHLASFVFGCAGGYAFLKRDPKQLHSGLASVTWSLLACAAIYAALKFSPQLQGAVGFQLAFKVSLLAPLFLGLIWSLARSDNALTRGLSARPLALLGEASYSLYILQTPLFISYRKLLLPHLGLSREVGFYVYLALLIGTSLLSLYLIERPARAFFMGSSKQARAPLPEA